MATKVGSLFVELSMASDKFENTYTKAFTQLKTLKGAAMAAGLAMTYLGKKIWEAGSAFEKQTKIIKAYLNVSSKEFSGLNSVVRNLGATTEFTSIQVAKAARVMAIAGMNMNQIMKALPATSQLATAGLISFEDAADISVATMRTFSLQAKDLARVNDVILTVVTKSNTTLERFATTMKYAGALASVYGYSVKDLAAYTGTLADANIRASLAGTQLSMAFQRNNKALKELGLKPGSLPLIKTIELIEKAGWSADKVMKVFSQRAGRAVLAIMQNKKRFNELSEAMDNAAGATNRIATEIRTSLQVRMQVLGSVVKDELISAFEALKPTFKILIDFTIYFVKALSGLVKIIGPVLIPLLWAVNTVFAGLTTMIGQLSATFAYLSEIVRITVNTFIHFLTLDWKGLKHDIKESAEAWTDYGNALDDVQKKQYENMAANNKMVSDSLHVSKKLKKEAMADAKLQFVQQVSSGGSGGLGGRPFLGWQDDTKEFIKSFESAENKAQKIIDQFNMNSVEKSLYNVNKKWDKLIEKWESKNEMGLVESLKKAKLLDSLNVIKESVSDIIMEMGNAPRLEGLSNFEKGLERIDIKYDLLRKNIKGTDEESKKLLSTLEELRKFEKKKATKVDFEAYTKERDKAISLGGEPLIDKRLQKNRIYFDSLIKKAKRYNDVKNISILIDKKAEESFRILQEYFDKMYKKSSAVAENIAKISRKAKLVISESGVSEYLTQVLNITHKWDEEINKAEKLGASASVLATLKEAANAQIFEASRKAFDKVKSGYADIIDKQKESAQIWEDAFDKMSGNIDSILGKFKKGDYLGAFRKVLKTLKSDEFRVATGSQQEARYNQEGNPIRRQIMKGEDAKQADDLAKTSKDLATVAGNIPGLKGSLGDAPENKGLFGTLLEAITGSKSSDTKTIGPMDATAVNTSKTVELLESIKELLGGQGGQGKVKDLEKSLISQVSGGKDSGSLENILGKNTDLLKKAGISDISSKIASGEGIGALPEKKGFFGSLMDLGKGALGGADGGLGGMFKGMGKTQTGQNLMQKIQGYASALGGGLQGMGNKLGMGPKAMPKGMMGPPKPGMMQKIQGMMGGKAGAGGLMGMMGGKAGAIGMGGDIIGQMVGGKTGGVVSGMAQGAQMGAIAGPWGMAAGAVIGGGLSMMGGKKKSAKKKAADKKKRAEEHQFNIQSETLAYKGMLTESFSKEGLEKVGKGSGMQLGKIGAKEYMKRLKELSQAVEQAISKAVSAGLKADTVGQSIEEFSKAFGMALAEPMNKLTEQTMTKLAEQIVNPFYQVANDVSSYLELKFYQVSKKYRKWLSDAYIKSMEKLEKGLMKVWDKVDKVIQDVIGEKLGSKVADLIEMALIASGYGFVPVLTSMFSGILITLGKIATKAMEPAMAAVFKMQQQFRKKWDVQADWLSEMTHAGIEVADAWSSDMVDAMKDAWGEIKGVVSGALEDAFNSITAEGAMHNFEQSLREGVYDMVVKALAKAMAAGVILLAGIGPDLVKLIGIMVKSAITGTIDSAELQKALTGISSGINQSLEDNAQVVDEFSGIMRDFKDDMLGVYNTNGSLGNVYDQQGTSNAPTTEDTQQTWWEKAMSPFSGLIDFLSGWGMDGSSLSEEGFLAKFAETLLTWLADRPKFGDRIKEAWRSWLADRPKFGDRIKEAWHSWLADRPAFGDRIKEAWHSWLADRPKFLETMYWAWKNWLAKRPAFGDRIKEAWGSWLGKHPDFGGKVRDAWDNWLKQLPKPNWNGGIAQGIYDFLQSHYSDRSNSSNNNRGHALGTHFIPNDGQYNLHKGEAVIPSDEVDLGMLEESGNQPIVINIYNPTINGVNGVQEFGELLGTQLRTAV